MRKTRARINNGKWTRWVPSRWVNGSVWRTDMPASVLNDQRFDQAVFMGDDRIEVLIPATELQRVLPIGAQRGSKWGPFNIDHRKQTIDGHNVTMEVWQSVP